MCSKVFVFKVVGTILRENDLFSYSIFKLYHRFNPVIHFCHSTYQSDLFNKTIANVYSSTI